MGDRQGHWEAVYRSKESTAVSWYQPSPARSLQLIAQCGVGRAQAIIDVGGGASLLVDALLQRGYQRLAVLDISATALQCAQQRLGGRAGEVEWFVDDVTRFLPPHRFALWHDRAVFHFLTEPAEREAYLGVLRRALEPGAHLLIATFALDGPSMCSGLPVERYDGAKMAATLGAAFELLAVQPELHTTPGGGEQRFNYFLFRYPG